MITYKQWTPSLKNRKVKCIKRGSGFGGSIGATYYIKGPSGASGGFTHTPKILLSLTPNGGAVGGWAYLSEFEFCSLTPASLTADIKDLKTQMTDLKELIAVKTETLQFMKDHNLKETEEDLIKTFRIMKKLKLGTIEDAKEIVKILNN